MAASREWAKLEPGIGAHSVSTTSDALWRRATTGDESSASASCSFENAARSPSEQPLLDAGKAMRTGWLPRGRGAQAAGKLAGSDGAAGTADPWKSSRSNALPGAAGLRETRASSPRTWGARRTGTSGDPGRARHKAASNAVLLLSLLLVLRRSFASLQNADRRVRGRTRSSLNDFLGSATKSGGALFATIAAEQRRSAGICDRTQNSAQPRC